MFLSMKMTQEKWFAPAAAPPAVGRVSGGDPGLGSKQLLLLVRGLCNEGQDFGLNHEPQAHAGL